MADYTSIGYDKNLNKNSSSSVVPNSYDGDPNGIGVTDFGTNPGGGTPDSSPNISSAFDVPGGSINGDALNNLWIRNWIKSNNYKPGVTGFMIDGTSGDVEFGKGKFRGDITGASGTFSGTIIASSGFIGGWTINSTALKDAAGVVGMSSAVTGSDDIRFWAGSVTPAVAPFKVTKTGVITASSGTIGGWILDTTLLKSASTAERIELNQSSNRISIFDAVNDKVVMGYLNGLPKNDGTGNWGVSNYGFWARSGDKLSIDGDGEYTSGDWIIQNDAAYLVNDSANNTIIRLGTDNGEKGLFIYNTAGTKLAKYISDEIFIGDSTNFLRYNSGGLSVGQIDVGDTGKILGGQSDYNTNSSGISGTADAAVLTGTDYLEDTRLHLNNGAWVGRTITADGKTMTITSSSESVFSGISWSGGGAPTAGCSWVVSDSIGGFFIGWSGGEHKFSIGEGSSGGNYLTWDGDYLRIRGNLDLTSIFNNVSYTVAELPIPPTTEGFLSPTAYEY